MCLTVSQPSIVHIANAVLTYGKYFHLVCTFILKGYNLCAGCDMWVQADIFKFSKQCSESADKTVQKHMGHLLMTLPAGYNVTPVGGDK